MLCGFFAAEFGPSILGLITDLGTENERLEVNYQKRKLIFFNAFLRLERSSKYRVSQIEYID